MALTQVQALEKFCLYLDYDKTKLDGETKLQFLARRKKEWSKQVVEAQIIKERGAEAEALRKTNVEADITGLDI